MNVFHKVTLQSLKKNRVRTIVTIIGIILSAAMICAVTTFVSSMQDYALRTAIYSDGSWHGNMTGTSYSVYDSVSASNKVESAIYLQQLGYAYAEGCTNKDKPYLYVLGGSEGTEALMPIHITSGEYPKSANEILLPGHLAYNGGVQHSIGDTLTLELGERMSDGYALHQNNPLLNTEESEEGEVGETLEVRETRTYTVVGFYSRFSGRLEEYFAPGYTAITVADDVPADDYLYDIYFKMNRAKDVYTFMEENGLGANRNTDVLLYQGLSQHDSFTNMLMGLAAIVIGLIMFGSVSLIYNAFSISVSERTKQFGLLSSVGATKKQLRGMVFFEALCVAAIGIPLGILSGIGGIGVTLMKTLRSRRGLLLQLLIICQAVVLQIGQGGGHLFQIEHLGPPLIAGAFPLEPGLNIIWRSFSRWQSCWRRLQKKRNTSYTLACDRTHAAGNFRRRVFSSSPIDKTLYMM